MAIEKKKIAIIGAGPVGCAFAVQLVNGGHDVTIVGRGERLARLEQNGGVVWKKSEKATETTKTPVKAVGSLNTSQPWDLILLTITEHQFDDALFSKLKACPKTTPILFLFNTFASLDKYFNPLGKERCILGFPAIIAAFYDDALVYTFMSMGQKTIVSSSEWRTIISAAGIACTHEPDMQSWLRTHAGLAVGFMSSMATAAKKRSGLTWSEANAGANAAREVFLLVQKLGNKITPSYFYYIGVAAPTVVTGILWIFSRIASMRDNTQAMQRWQPEMLALADSIIASAPSEDDVRLVKQLRAKFV